MIRHVGHHVGSPEARVHVEEDEEDESLEVISVRFDGLVRCKGLIASLAVNSIRRECGGEQDKPKALPCTKDSEPISASLLIAKSMRSVVEQSVESLLSVSNPAMNLPAVNAVDYLEIAERATGGDA